LKEQTAGILQVVGFAISRQDGIIGKNVFVGNFVIAKSEGVHMHTAPERKWLVCGVCECCKF
jgi:hypothetical protein